ncbi:hypothetical protein BGZ83_005370 [Gryganskiella cystojenkinii]|nr:hypothetical protein BGZ83_005370 [Gryganskiella cystojenkinii]
MRSFTLSAAVAILALAITGSIQASPLPKEPVADYIPLSKRTFTSDDWLRHDALHKRSSAGYNDWGCKVSTAHPRPIIFVHGLGSNGLENWQYMGPRFALKGYCTFTIIYGQYKNIPLLAGLDKMENSAAQLATFVDQVLASTGSTKVDLVGHSEGSMMPRYYLKFLNGASKVVLVDSPFLQNLNSPNDTVPGVQYHFISSKVDELVIPYTSGFLLDAKTNPLAKNVVLQDLCALDVSGHIIQMSDPIAFNSIAAFLDPKADQTVNCLDAIQ